MPQTEVQPEVVDFEIEWTVATQPTIDSSAELNKGSDLVTVQEIVKWLGEILPGKLAIKQIQQFYDEYYARAVRTLSMPLPGEVHRELETEADEIKLVFSMLVDAGMDFQEAYQVVMQCELLKR